MYMLLEIKPSFTCLRLLRSHVRLKNSVTSNNGSSCRLRRQSYLGDKACKLIYKKLSLHTGQEANVQFQKISMYMLPLQNGLEFPSDGGVSRDQNNIQRNRLLCFSSFKEMASSIDVNNGEIKKSAKYKWQLGHSLGKGTCSVVAEAVCTFCSKSICRRHSQVLKGAVKIFKQGHQFEQAATNEIEILEYMNRQDESPYKYYIVHLLDYFLYKDQLHLVYEKLDCNLHHILLKNSGKGLPLSIIKRCSWDIVRALSFLATNRVLHGDLKLSNIMWNSNRGMFQLVDFGLSFVEEQQPRQPLQSPGYQSPEAQAWNRLVAEGIAHRKSSRCSFASDMWSFSYVLWYIYTGMPAPRCEIDEPTCVTCLQEEGANCLHFKKINQELPEDDREITPEQHELFLDFIMRMMKCRPEQRITPFNAMQHAFLNSFSWCTPHSLKELLLLPSRILQLTNIHLDDLSSDLLLDELMDVREECAKFGAVKGFKYNGDSAAGYKVYVEFSDADDCSRAHSALTGREYNGKTVITSFYPIDYYYTDYFWR